MISQGIIDACGLKPIGMTQAHGVDGIHDTELFLVNIRLPNAVGFANVIVTRGKLHGSDALIGMNIIAQGDFAVSGTQRHHGLFFPNAFSCLPRFCEGPRQSQHTVGQQNLRAWRQEKGKAADSKPWRLVREGDP